MSGCFMMEKIVVALFILYLFQSTRQIFSAGIKMFVEDSNKLDGWNADIQKMRMYVCHLNFLAHSITVTELSAKEQVRIINEYDLQVPAARLLLELV